MSQILPSRFLFRYSIPVRHLSPPSKRGKKLLNLPNDSVLPDFGALEGQVPFGELRLGWSAAGLGLSVEVRGKRGALKCEPAVPETGDGLQVWVDTRNTQSIHRASRFCHHFCLLPVGGGAARKEPLVKQRPIARAREESPLADAEKIAITADVAKDGYLLQCWFPAEVLHGYDPEATPRLGFYYYLRDQELGEQYLSVGPEFPFTADPSLWATLELIRD